MKVLKGENGEFVNVESIELVWKQGLKIMVGFGGVSVLVKSFNEEKEMDKYFCKLQKQLGMEIIND